MPCNVTREEIEYYERKQREEWERDGRWDLLATKEQLAAWLCESMRDQTLSQECWRWFGAHRKHNDKVAT